MFDKRTVFILGAGASWHYNYPTGEDLVKRIIQKTEIIITCFENENNNRHVAQPEEMPIFFENKFGRPGPDHVEILDLLRSFIERLSQVDPPVIDYFLDWNQDLQDIGRLMIAWVILDREREYLVNGLVNYNHKRVYDESPFETNPIKNIRNFKDNWYRFILYKMVSGCKQDTSLKRNQIKFITFNYDVSLETYLYRGLKAIEFLNIKETIISEFLKNKFVHMYGQIREDHFSQFQPIPKSNSDKRIRNYKKILDLAYAASKGIRPIGSSDKDNQDAIQEARDAIEWAEDIYILGYGFDENNNRRLGLESLTPNEIQNQSDSKSTNKRVFFTNYGDANSVNKKAGYEFVRDQNLFIDSFRTPFSGSTGHRMWSVVYEKSIRNVYEALEKDFNLI
ncbi:MAG: hypothetical protein WBK55_01420 [Alphaproteobacteria bacterium]